MSTPTVPTVTLESRGACLVLGDGEVALAAGERLAQRLAVTVVLRDDADALERPLRAASTLCRGAVRRARGHLGAFRLELDGFSEAVAAPRGALRFGPPEDDVAVACDIVVDLTGGRPLLAGGTRRDGYLRADPRDPLAVERALFDAAGLVGSFEKPRYVAVRPHLCAHGRNGAVGCTRCLDLCPLDALSPDGDRITLDPYACAGCGGCQAACPTGALRDADPPPETVHGEIARALAAARAAGHAPLLLLHDRGHGTDMLALLDRHGDGLPGGVAAVALRHATVAGPELLFGALAEGASRVLLLTGPGDEAEPLAGHVAMVDGVMAALGHGDGRVAVLDVADPIALGESLAGSPRPAPVAAAGLAAAGDPRERQRAALAHLHRHGATAPESVPLPAGAPWGAVEVADGCTLCLACVGVCPTGALADSADAPRLSFREDACVQCGLCVVTCPERVMTLEPRLAFAPAAATHVVLRQEEPFACIACGKPFAVRSSIERVLARLVDHPMMADPAASDRLQMCGDCRVADIAGQGRRDVPRPRTSDDWLARAVSGGPNR